MKFKSDIALFRILIVVFLLLFHAFCPYGNNWTSVGEYVPIYFWIDNWSYSFFLQGFVFISGLLFGFQLKKKKEEHSLSIKAEIKKKVLRLLLPSLVFSNC